MSGVGFTVNSDHSSQAFKVWADELYAEHKYITWSTPRIGADRSLDQNALFHVWLTEYAAHLLKIPKNEVSKGVIEGMKRTVKAKFLAETACAFMIHEVHSPMTGDKKNDYTSSADWKTGEMFMVLERLQMYAAEQGLVLEAKGQHAKLKREQG